MACELRKLKERRARVKEAIDSLSGQKLIPAPVSLDSYCPSSSHNLVDVGLKVGDEGIHGLGVERERFGGPIEDIGEDAQTEVSSSVEEK